MHGPVRKVLLNGTVIEATYLNNVEHGLMRKIDNNTVVVSLWTDGTQVSFFKFGEDFIETYRNVSPGQELFSKLFPYKFSRIKDDRAMLNRMLASPLTGLPHGIKYLHSRI